LEEEEKGLQRREIYRKEKRERSPGAAWWPISGCVGFLWWSWWQRGLEFATAGGEREKVAETGKRLILWLTLDLVFFSLRA
jgi:hypothetical protein